MNEIIKLTNTGDYMQLPPDASDAFTIGLWAKKTRRSDSDNTANQYNRVAAQFLADVGKPLQAINYADLDAWTKRLPGAINTRRAKINTVRSLFAFALKMGYIRVNPALIIDPPQKEETKQRKILSEEQVIKLVNTAKLSDRDRAILRCMYSLGCRVSELINIRWYDVAPVKNKRAEVTIRGKGSKTRTSVMSAGAYASILAIKPTNARPEDFIFLSNQGRRMDRTTINYLFDKLSKSLGTHISPHWLRHAHVSHSLERGANPVATQQQVGHASLDTTTGYAHTTESSADYLVI